MAIIILVIFQIVVMHEYDIVTLYIIHAISYGLWIVILSLLAIAFFFWYVSSNKNLMVLILVLSMIAYVVNGITSVATYFDMLTQQKRVVTSTDVAYFPEFSIESIGSQIRYGQSDCFDLLLMFLLGLELSRCYIRTSKNWVKSSSGLLWEWL